MRTQYRLLFLLVAITFSPQCQAQTNEQEITDVIYRVFASMEKGDSAMLHTTFAQEVTMVTISRDKNDVPVIRYEYSIADFLKAIGTPHSEIYYEEVWNLKIQVDGDFAQAWCDYAFYAGNKFNHCGVDAFHLYRDKKGWKIFHLADTRRKDNCVIPSKIQLKHK